MADDFKIWTAGEGRYDILTMREGQGWKVVIEDTVAGSELARYVDVADSGWEAGVAATKHLPEGTTVDQPVPDHVEARWAEEAEEFGASYGMRH